jgi:pantetheine-phosphate adenylyltransferase
MQERQAGDRIAVCPGTFDPVTLGHVDLVGRAARLFDRVVVAILVNDDKTPLFTRDERVALTRATFAGIRNVDVDVFDGLLVDYVARCRAVAVVRGLRSGSDFEYELPMALMNRRLRASHEPVFLAPAPELSCVSSRLVKEVWRLGGDVSGLVPLPVAERLRERRARPAAAR